MNQHAHAHDDHDLDWAAMVEFAELEAEVLISVLLDATSSLSDLCESEGLEVRRIIDIGSGPGVGTCVLGQAFDDAEVVAADGSGEMLANVAARAARLGLSDRVTTRLVDLPDDVDSLGPADLVWASMVLHHVGDEAAALRGLRARLEPGGLVALTEFGDPLRVVPDHVELGRPGLWERLDDARATWLAGMRAGLPGATTSEDYPTMLEAAGFELVTDRMIAVDLGAPLDDRARRLALSHLKLMREHAGPHADAGDLAVIDTLTDESDPAGITQRPDALLHVSRRLLVAKAVPIASVR